ncbi:MAG: GTPase HflX [Nitrospinae bacterium]|nr:GTPase HflX [Nitrospinota bacterium]
MYGNTAGLSHFHRKGLERIYRRRIPPGLLITDELLLYLSRLSRELGRQLAVLIDRKGKITHVVAGNDHQIVIPNLGQRRVAEKRLAGYRCVHTHLKGETLTQDDLNDLLLLRLDAIAAVDVQKSGLPGNLSLGHISAAKEDSYTLIGPAPLVSINDAFPSLIGEVEEELSRTVVAKKVEGGNNALLIHVSNMPKEAMDFSLDELAELARSAEINVADRVIQRRALPDPKYLMGKGKLQEFMIKALSLGADMVIFDTELTPAQIKAITDFTDLEVLDRTQLILGIFEKRATSRDGKVRVALAQMRYLLPRLGAKESALSRIRGGIGLRGPGETTAEVQRRHLQSRITAHERELRSLKDKRTEKRKQRLRSEVKTISIIGYTNAGKSTLINRLTHSDLVVKNLLFSTLDPASRKLRLPNGEFAVISDTVGLIRNMPESLRGVFRATMEELAEADLLINVVDVSNPDFEDHIKVTDEILEDLKLQEVPRLLVFNKIEMLDAELAHDLCRRFDAVGISAAAQLNLGGLLDAITQKLIV